MAGPTTRFASGPSCSSSIGTSRSRPIGRRPVLQPDVSPLRRSLASREIQIALGLAVACFMAISAIAYSVVKSRDDLRNQREGDLERSMTYFYGGAFDRPIAIDCMATDYLRYACLL